MERFWKRVDKSEDCWLWQGARDQDGYGQFMVNYVNYRAHRWILGAAAGDVVRHKCNTPACVRPDHLVIGTQSENVLDEVRAGTHARLRYSDDIVAAIRADYIPYVFGIRKVAAKYGVSTTYVDRIVKHTARTVGRDSNL